MAVNHLGEIIALATAVCWTATSMSFQHATMKVGSLPVNILRLIIAFFLFSIVSNFIRGSFIPTDANSHVWTWMTLSGIVGFVIGDYFLFKSYEYVSARVAMLIMATSPIFSALISWLFLSENLGFMELMAMAVTIGGISIVVLVRADKSDGNDNSRRKIKFSFHPLGLLFALGGSVGQAVGLVMSKYGMGNFDPFAATHIRVIAGVIGFIIIIFIGKGWHKVSKAIFDRKAMIFIVIGSIFGPFVGVYLSLLSVKFTSIGIASTLMSIVPILIIPPAVIFFKEKISFREIVGALVAVGGVILFFL